MNLSLDGYVDHDRMSTGPELFKHWTEHVAGLTGSVYGRGVYELMRKSDSKVLGSPDIRVGEMVRHDKWVFALNCINFSAKRRYQSLLDGDSLFILLESLAIHKYIWNNSCCI